MKLIPHLALVSLVLFSACKKDEGTDDSGDTSDTSDTPADLTGQFGSVVAIHWPADADYPEGTAGAAFFLDNDGGIINLAECLIIGAQCLSALPAEGNGTVATADFLETATFHDGGSEVTVGGEAWFDLGSYDVPVYEAEPSNFGPGMGNIAFSGDLLPYTGTEDFEYAAKFVATSPDPTARIAATTGDTLNFAWTSGGAGQVMLRYGSTVKAIADNGALALPIADLAMEAPFDSRSVRLSRVTFTDVDAGGNTVRVQTISEQWYYVDFEDTVGWDELEMENICSSATASEPTPPGDYYGTLEANTNNISLGEENPTTGYDTLGNDGIIKVQLAAGEKITVKARQLGLDASVYLMTDCQAPASAVAGADETLTSQFEEFEFTSTAGGTYYLVIDAWEEDEGAKFTLEFSIQ